MTDTPAGPSGTTPPVGQVSDRMQALLSRAVEEQVSEQRAVSTVLGELRSQVASLGEAVRLAASDASVERLGGVVSTVVADLRTSTSLLGQRIEALSKRVEAVAVDTAAPTEQAVVRLAALSGDIAAQGDAVERMQAALEQLAAFPAALAALQTDVAGMHDRLQPLAEIRASIGDIGARTASGLAAMRPQLDALEAKVDAFGEGAQPDRLRDSIVDALTGRLDKLVEAAGRPVIGPEVLRSGLGDLRASLDAAMGDRFEELGAGLGAVENRLGQIGERVADVGDAAGGVPAIATDLSRLSTRVEDLHTLRDDIAKVAVGVRALQEDSTGTTLTDAVAAVREELEQLGERMAASVPPPVEEIANLVSLRVADRLVETLAPRIADVVLTRVSAALVTQLGEALSPRMKGDTELVIRAATADSERRVLAHVDEAILSLAEALLRRRRGGKSGGAAVVLPKVAQSWTAGPDDEADGETADLAQDAVADEPVQEIVERLHMAEAPVAPKHVDPAPVAEAKAVALDAPPQQPATTLRAAVTTGLAPARVSEVKAPEKLVDTPGPEAPPVASVESQRAPEREAAAAPEETQDAAPPKAAQAAPPPKAQPPARAPGGDALKPASRAKPRQAAAPAPPPKKATRPTSKPPAKPILERTPDLDDDDIEPVRTAPGRPRPVSRPAAAPPPRPVERASAPPTQRTEPTQPTPEPTQRTAQPTQDASPSVPTPFPPAQPAPTAAPSPPPQEPPKPPPPPPAEVKRKPWWRPGG